MNKSRLTPFSLFLKRRSVLPTVNDNVLPRYERRQRAAEQRCHRSMGVLSQSVLLYSLTGRAALWVVVLAVFLVPTSSV